MHSIVKHMSEIYKIDYTTELIDGRMQTAILTMDGRQYEMTVDIGNAEFTCRSLDGRPIPMQAMWVGYREIHREAVTRRTGTEPAGFNPEEQIKEVLNDEETADSHISSAAHPPAELAFSDESDDSNDER